MLFAETSDWVTALQAVTGLLGLIVPPILVYMAIKQNEQGKSLSAVKKIVDGQQSARQGETDDLRAAAMRSMETGEPILASDVIAATEKKTEAVAKVVAASEGSQALPAQPGPTPVIIVPAEKALLVKVEKDPKKPPT